MRTRSAIELPAEIAVVAEQPKPITRIALGLQPSVYGIATSAQVVLTSVCRPVTIDVVDAEEPQFRFAAAFADAAICINALLFDFLAMSLIHRLDVFWMLACPLMTVVASVLQKTLSVGCVIGSVACSFARFEFRRCEFLYD